MADLVMVEGWNDCPQEPTEVGLGVCVTSGKCGHSAECQGLQSRCR